METNEYKLSPITDRQALNVAMNTLHTIIHASSIGPTDVVLRAEHDKAQPKDSDIRAAYEIVLKLCEAFPRDWQVSSVRETQRLAGAMKEAINEGPLD
jgi:hypothetical protein